MKLDATTAKLVLGSPSTSPETLTDIARDFPDLQAQVAAHPAASPELLDWLAANGTPEARSTVAARLSATAQPAQAQPPAPPVVPAAEPDRRARNVIWLIAILVAAALVVWLLAGPLSNRNQPPSGVPSTTTLTEPATPSDRPTAPAPANVQWLPISGADEIQLSPTSADPDSDIAVFTRLPTGANGTGLSSITFQGVDLATQQTLWTATIQPGDASSGQGVSWSAGVSDGFVVLTVNDQLQVLDARTGANKLTATMGPTVVGTSAGGVLLTSDGTTITAHPPDNLTGVLWQAAGVPFSRAVMQPAVFGGGRWVNTNNGVVDIATGQPAPFGSDAHANADGSDYVLYDGPNENDVVRTACSNGTCEQTLWDPVRDMSAGHVVTYQAGGDLDWLCADPSSPVFLIASSTTSLSAFTMTAYSWTTGQQLWQVPTPASTLGCGTFAGNAYVIRDSSDNAFVAYDLTSGAPLRSGYAQSVTVNQGIAYLSMYLDNAYHVDAYDGNNGFTPLWTIDPPSAVGQLQSVGRYVVATGGPNNQVWVLSGM